MGPGQVSSRGVAISVSIKHQAYMGVYILSITSMIRRTWQGYIEAKPLPSEYARPFAIHVRNNQGQNVPLSSSRTVETDYGRELPTAKRVSRPQELGSACPGYSSHSDRGPRDGPLNHAPR